MDRSQAIIAIQRSLERGSSTPCTWVEDREAYIEEKSSQLLQVVIDPVPAVVSGECYETGVKEQLTGKPVFAIARRESNWLLYVPETGKFSLAYGENSTDLRILGFSSDDALAEWLG